VRRVPFPPILSALRAEYRSTLHLPHVVFGRHPSPAQTPEVNGSSDPPLVLKVEADGYRQRARGDVMRPAEGRKEVIERILVGQIDGRQAKAPFALLAVEKVVVSHR